MVTDPVTAPAVDIHGLTHRYPGPVGRRGEATGPSRPALDGVTLSVSVGERVGVLEGFMDAWERLGYPVTRPAAAP